MFIITYKNNVILGPMKWNAKRFIEVIENDCGITVELPQTNESYLKVNNDIEIYPVQGTPNPSYDPAIEFLHGPFYEYIDGIAYSSMTVEKIPLMAAQNLAKAKAANIRWTKQNSGVTVTLNGVDYNFKTDIETKSIFHQYITADLETVNYKIDQDTWIVLSKDDIKTIFNSIVNHVQSAFDWEVNKLSEIVDSTHETLPTVNLE